MLEVLVTIASVIYTEIRLHRLRNITAETTAQAPHYWAQAALGSCLLTGVMLATGSQPAASVCHSLAAVMLLTPAISVLGARRPGADVWSWFIVLPLIVVLLWPILAELPRASTGQKLVLPAPTVLGFLFVLLMGAGNYFGTRNTGASLTSAAGVLLILSGVTDYAWSDWSFPAGCVCLAAASRLVPSHFFVCQQSAGHADSLQGASRLWCDFRDLFGIVWAKRFMDRMNLFAERESWPVMLTLDGFQPQLEDTSGVRDSDANTLPPRVIQIFGWLLSRFVSPDFIARYLDLTQQTDTTTSPG